MIRRKRCKAEGCYDLFPPRPQCKDQKYCSKPECQQKRKNKWQREMRQTDKDYRANDADARRGWVEKNETTTKENLNLDMNFSYPMADLGRLDIKLTHRRFEIGRQLDLGFFDEDGQRDMQEVETDLTRDETTALSMAINLIALPKQQIKLGVDLRFRKRHARARLFEVEDGEREEVPLGGVFRIDETRLDAYIMDTWDFTDHH